MTLSYPALSCPFPAAINPHAETIRHTTIAWAQQHGLVQDAAGVERLQRQQFHIFVARIYPHAPLAALQWISDWNTWVFLIDDQFDETEQGRAPAQIAQLRATLLAILGGDMPKQENPFIQAFVELATDLRAQVDAAWLEQYIQHTADCFAASIWEANNRIQGRIPDLATYLRMRPDASAVYMYLTVIKFANQLNLSSAVHAHPTVHKLALHTNNIISWCNDIISLEKEHRHGDVHNLVIVLQHAHQCSWSEAINHAVAMHDAEVQRFQALATQLPSFTPAVDTDLHQYVMGLQFWIRGCFDWEQATGRYRPIALDGKGRLPAATQWATTR